MSEETAAPQSPRRHRGRSTVLAIVLGCLLVALYVVTVVLYARSGQVQSDTSNAQPPPGGIMVTLTPQNVNAAGQRVTMDLSIRTSAELTSTNGLTPNQTINVIVAPTGGEQSIAFQKNEVPAVIPISVISDGEVEVWPFDTYTTKDLIVGACADDCADHAPLHVNVFMSGHVPGWNLSAQVGSDESIHFTAARSGSTVAFGVVLLALMIAMPCLVLFVGISTLRGNRRVEPSFMSWMAAMLFATIPLRTFLPGSPPIGSWIDYTIVLWVIAGLVSGLIIYVVAWNRQHKRERHKT